MEKLFLSFRRNVGLSCVVILTLVLSAACKKDSVDEYIDPVSHLMIFNLAPDKSAVKIALSGNVITSRPIDYPNYSAVYQDVEPGQQTIESHDASLGVPMANTPFSFEEEKFYSLFVMGNQGAYSNIIVRDNYEDLPVGSGKTFIRYVNAIPDSSDLTVNITANGALISVTDVHYGDVSEFLSLDGLDMVIGISNGTTVAVNEIFNFAVGKAYTVLFTGIPEAADLSKSVKILYALSGTSGN